MTTLTLVEVCPGAFQVVLLFAVSNYFNVQVPCADSMCWFYVLHLCATSMCRFHVLQLCARTSNVDKTAHGRCPFSWCLSETMSSMSSNLSQCCHRSGFRAYPTHDGHVHFHGQHMKFISIELCTSIWFLVTEHDRTKWHWACLSKAMNSKRWQSISNPSLPCPFPCTTHEVMVPVITVFPFSCVVMCGYARSSFIVVWIVCKCSTDNTVMLPDWIMRLMPLF